jgi:hypothetical protein
VCGRVFCFMNVNQCFKIGKNIETSHQFLLIPRVNKKVKFC